MGSAETSLGSSISAGKCSDHVEAVHQPSFRRLLWKLDVRVVGPLGVVIIVECLDHVNLSIARITGIDKDLKIGVDYRFSLIILVGAISSMLVQIPMILLGYRMFPPYAICISAMAWAASLFGIAFASKWLHLLPCRIIAGASGGIIFQIIHVLVQTWYPRYQVARRFAWLAIFGWLSKAAGGFAAWGITHMHGLGGLAGWRWIFVWSGIFTFAAALISLLFVVGYADTPQWKGVLPQFLTLEEHRIVVDRIAQDRGDSERDHPTLIKSLGCASDFKIWLFGLIYMAHVSILVSLALFSPIIIHKDFGFDAAKSQAFYALPYIATAVLLIIASEISDRIMHRGIIIACCVLFATVGLAMIGFAKPVGVRYTGMFFANSGLGSGLPLISALLANNVRGFQKRSFASALMVAFSGLGGIIGSLIFRSQDAPHYFPGLIASTALALLTIVLIVLLDVYFIVQNGKQATTGKILEDLQGFRYTY